MPGARADLDAADFVRLLPAGGVMAVWTVLMFQAGGYRPGEWLPAGLIMVALLAIAMLGAGRLLPVARAPRLALLALVGLTAWCYASIAWSDAPGLAWEAANLLLVAVAGAWTLALAPWGTRTALGLMVAFSVAAAAACVEGILGSLAAVDLSADFDDFRYSLPLEYANATAAFAFMAAIPALLLAARPDASVPAKAAGQGLATFLCAFALLPQSRGAILGGIAAVAVLAIAVPFRWRLVFHALLLTVAVAFAAGPIADVYTAASTTGTASGPLADALTAILIATGIGTVGGLALALAEERLVLGDHHARSVRIAGIAATVLALVAVTGVGVAKSALISQTASNHWEALTHPGEEFDDGDDSESSRLTRTDPSDRYDYWRVSVDGFRSNPIGGMGAGGFEQRYALDRRSATPSRYPHSLVMKVLGDTGLVGVVLAGAFLAVVAGGLVRGARRRRRRERAVAAGALAVLAFFLAHGFFDWLEAFPVLVGPALGFPLVALVVLGRDRDGEEATSAPPPARRGRTVLTVSAVALAAVLAAGSLLAPWLSLRYRERAADRWGDEPAAAYDDLDRAAGLDPLGAQPLVLKGVIALIRGDLGVSQEAFGDALDRQEAWLPHFGLAVIADQRGDEAEVERRLAIAVRENPLDKVLPDVAEKVRGDGRVDPSQILREALQAPHATTEPVS